MRNTFFRRHAVGTAFVACSMLYVLVEALVSYHEGSFLPSQVMALWHEPGIAFLAHGGMWGDFLLLPFVVAWIIERHHRDWTLQSVKEMGLVGFNIALANHLLLITTQTIPDPLGWVRDMWSTLIAMHFVYMTAYVALLGLLYLYSPKASRTEVVVISAIFGVHMTFGTHVPLGIADLWTNWSWCPAGFLSEETAIVLSGIWCLLAGFSWKRGGPRATITVLGIGTSLAAVLLAVIYASP